MESLLRFVADNLLLGTCSCGTEKCSQGHTSDLVFAKFHLKHRNYMEERRHQMAILIEDAVNNKKGVFVQINPLDNGQHSYIEVGGWIGSQQYAISFMALGHMLGIWGILTPRQLKLPESDVKSLAALGMVLIDPYKKESESEAA